MAQRSQRHTPADYLRPINEKFMHGLIRWAVIEDADGV